VQAHGPASIACSSPPRLCSKNPNPRLTERPPLERLAASYGTGDADVSTASATLRPVEDYTHKYKGEQVEVELFGGEYQDGTLTAYCGIEGVPHIELNGHILIPLQNIASLHCSSRCDAPEPDWPPRGLTGADGEEP
jgi:hypothetical protein